MHVIWLAKTVKIKWSGAKSEKGGGRTQSWWCGINEAKNHINHRKVLVYRKHYTYYTFTKYAIENRYWRIIFHSREGKKRQLQMFQYWDPLFVSFLWTTHPSLSSLLLHTCINLPSTLLFVLCMLGNIIAQNQL